MWFPQNAINSNSIEYINIGADIPLRSPRIDSPNSSSRSRSNSESSNTPVWSSARANSPDSSPDSPQSYLPSMQESSNSDRTTRARSNNEHSSYSVSRRESRKRKKDNLISVSHSTQKKEKIDGTHIDFTTPWKHSDIVFLVDNKSIYANKMQLSLWSPVFDAMFNGDFKEKNANEIPLPDKTVEEIVALMGILHPPGCAIRESTVEPLLELAEEYQIDHLKKQCEDFLLSRPMCLNNYCLAVRFGLKSLKYECLDYVKNAPIFDIIDDSDIMQLGENSPLVRTLLDRCDLAETRIDSLEIELKRLADKVNQCALWYDGPNEVTFRHKWNISDIVLEKTKFSPTFMLHQILWMMYLQSGNSLHGGSDEKMLVFYLKAKPAFPSSSSWSCKAIANLKIINKRSDKTVVRHIDQLFRKGEYESWGFREFISLKKLLDPKQGFIENNIVTFEVHLKADKPTGVSKYHDSAI